MRCGGGDCGASVWVEAAGSKGQACYVAGVVGSTGARQGGDAFLLGKKCEWPGNVRERYRTAEAAEEGTASAKLLQEVQVDIAAL